MYDGASVYTTVTDIYTKVTIKRCFLTLIDKGFPDQELFYLSPNTGIEKLRIELLLNLIQQIQKADLGTKVVRLSTTFRNIDICFMSGRNGSFILTALLILSFSE